MLYFIGLIAMIYQQRKTKNQPNLRSLMQWLEVEAGGVEVLIQYIYFLFLSAKHPTYGKNKSGNTFRGFTLFGSEKEEIF